jgi:hypothetical protein
MCVLCGVWAEEHWIEIVPDAHASAVDGTMVLEQHTANRGRRLRDRSLRVRLVNLLLRGYGLQLQDWEGNSYIVRNSKGASAVVTDVASVWQVAEQMLGRPLDPLDPQLLERVQPRNDADGKERT